MKHTITLLAAALAAAPFAASAAAPDYTFVEAGYVHTDIDDLGDGDGVAINGSVAVSDAFHVFGGYSAQEGDESGVSVDLDQMQLGLGFRHAISDRADLLVRAAYERAETDVSVAGLGSVEGDADGYSLEAGYRGYLFEKLDAWVMLGYIDLNEADVAGYEIDVAEGHDDEIYGRLGAQFKFNPTWGLVGEGRFAEDVTQVFVGVRASF